MQAKAASAPRPPRGYKRLEVLSESEWAAFSGKARWDSIVALRGPDLVNSDTLKYFTTSVIRYRLSGVMRVGGMVNRQLPFVVLPEGLSKCPKSGFDVTHFYHHIEQAAEWLTIPIVRCSEAIWAKMFTGDSYFAIMPLLRDYLPVGSPHRVTLDCLTSNHYEESE